MAEGEGIEPPRRFRRHLSKVLHYRSANLPRSVLYFDRKDLFQNIFICIISWCLQSTQMNLSAF